MHFFKFALACFILLGISPVHAANEYPAALVGKWKLEKELPKKGTCAHSPQVEIQQTGEGLKVRFGKEDFIELKEGKFQSFRKNGQIGLAYGRIVYASIWPFDKDPWLGSGVSVFEVLDGTLLYTRKGQTFQISDDEVDESDPTLAITGKPALMSWAAACTYKKK